MSLEKPWQALLNVYREWWHSDKSVDLTFGDKLLVLHGDKGLSLQILFFQRLKFLVTTLELWKYSPFQNLF